MNVLPMTSTAWNSKKYSTNVFNVRESGKNNTKIYTCEMCAYGIKCFSGAYLIACSGRALAPRWITFTKNIYHSKSSYMHIEYLYVYYEINKKYVKRDKIQRILKQHCWTRKIISPLRRYLWENSSFIIKNMLDLIWWYKWIVQWLFVYNLHSSLYTSWIYVSIWIPLCII